MPKPTMFGPGFLEVYSTFCAKTILDEADSIMSMLDSDDFAGVKMKVKSWKKKRRKMEEEIQKAKSIRLL